jgi:hypothetical protein
MNKPILNLELNGKSEVMEFIGDHAFWTNGFKYGWNIKHEGIEKVIFATKNFNNDILDLIGKGTRKADVKYDDSFKHYKAYYVRPFTIKK